MDIDDIAKMGPFEAPVEESPIIKVIGVGGGGGNAVQHMYNAGIKDVSFVICNTDRQALLNSSVPMKLQLGTSGLGAGNKPEKAREAAEESIADIEHLFDDDTKMVFITAGMGGGTGTGAAPVVARVAREKQLLTIGIVTIPFLFEGPKKIKKALQGVQEISKYVDALLVINNNRLTEIYPDLEFLNAFGKADDTLTTAARGISELITNTDHKINIDFNDVDTTLRNGGAAIISNGYGEGEHRVTKAIQDALNSPLLRDSDIFGSKRILFNIYMDPEAEDPFKMEETKEINDFMSNVSPDVDVIWGVAYDKTLGNKIKITLLAAGFSTENLTQPTAQQDQPAKPASIFDDGPAVAPKNEDESINEQIDKLYGPGANAGLQQSTHKQIILTPEQLTDDAILETFENHPTYTRDRKLVDEIKNAASKPQEQPLPNTNEKPMSTSKDNHTSGTVIEFNL